MELIESQNGSLANFLTPEITFLAFDASLLPFITILPIF
jgi:hypothetical protein